MFISDYRINHIIYIILRVIVKLTLSYNDTPFGSKMDPNQKTKVYGRIKKTSNALEQARVKKYKSTYNKLS